MAGWRVRGASPEDAAALARLRWEFRVEAGEPVESEAAFLDRAARWMAARLAGDRWQAWLAEVDGAAPAGCIWLQVIEKLPNPGDEEELHGYVTSLFVAPALRGKGLGSLLLEAALDSCRAAGVDSVVLWPTTRSRPLYERLGFASPGDVMELRMGTGRRLP